MTRIRHRRQFEILEPRQMLSSDSVVIAEFMASNQNTNVDGFGESSDWIEIFNGTAAEVDLQRWSLSDDPKRLDKWSFDAEVILPSHSRLLVWASGRDTTDGNGQHHTNFKLNASGEFLGLANSSGQLVSAFGDLNTEYPPQATDISYGLNAKNAERFFLEPTPNEPNGVGTLGFVADTKFSVDRGFFDESFALQISSATPAATLIYTLDGSQPTVTNGISVNRGNDAPSVTLQINTTTTVRAMAYRPDWEPTNVDTQTYLFLHQVIRQTGEGLPNTWGHNGADYEMDQRIVNHASYRDTIIDDLQAVPTLSLVTELDNWFDRRTGIYPRGQGSPVPVSVELLLADETGGFQVDGSVEIQGGSSTNRWKSDKLSMQLKFKREFGDAKLEYPLFGDGVAVEFDTLVLDARLNQVWHYGGGSDPESQRRRAQYTRDQFVADLQNQLGGRAPSGQWVHVYLNGIYWGIHNLHERPDEHFAAAYFGGDEEDYDVIKHNTSVVNGSYANYQALLNAVNTNPRLHEHYQVVADMLDVDDFISYMLINYYVGNTDWAHHNWYATFNKASPEGKWRFHSWDAEHVLKGIRDDATGRDDERGPTRIHNRLMRNDEYRTKFMDAVQKQFFNDGLLTPSRAAVGYQTRLDAVYQALVPESARWGDNQRTRAYTRDVEWVAERDRLLENYFPVRTDVVVEQLRDRGFFHRYDAPAFNVHGGVVEFGFPVSIASVGDAFYTLDGSDPQSSKTRLPYHGPFPIRGTTTTRVRALHANEWSALTEATFETVLVGDFSDNNALDSADLELLFAAIRTGETDEVFDLNKDLEVDSADVDFWIVELAETRRGDTNLDGQVNFSDFLALSSNFGKSPATWSQGDSTGDGAVTFDDFLVLSVAFGFSRV